MRGSKSRRALLGTDFDSSPGLVTSLWVAAAAAATASELDSEGFTHSRAVPVIQTCFESSNLNFWGLYSIRGLIKRAGSAIKTQNSLKEYCHLIQCQMEIFGYSLIPNKHISKLEISQFQTNTFQNPTTWIQKCWIWSVNVLRLLSMGRKQAFKSNLFTNYEIIQFWYSSYQVLVVTSLTIKCGLLSEALDFNYSAQDYQQSGFWWCCQYLTCTIPTRKRSDDVILSGHAEPGS